MISPIKLRWSRAGHFRPDRPADPCPAHPRRLRAINGLERLNNEIERRTRVAALFPDEASLLRLASAVLSEISDD